MPSDPRQSARLTYRAIEPGDEDLLRAGNDDHVAYYSANGRNASIPGGADAKRLLLYLNTQALLGVAICLPQQGHAGDANKETLCPIGSMSLSHVPPEMRHHRFANIGIKLLPQYRGKGYGTEAINWILDWAFDRLALHRVGVDVFGWNDGARRLYERLGFVHEGSSRELLFHEGRFWPEHHYSMLENEWKALRAKE